MNNPGFPVRTCLGCRARKDLREMDRLALVSGEDGRFTVKWDPGRKLGGRGAWLCRDGKCLALALKKRAFGRAFRTSDPLDLKQMEAKLKAGQEPEIGGTAGSLENKSL